MFYMISANTGNFRKFLERIGFLIAHFFLVPETCTEKYAAVFDIPRPQ